ncbi:hypothetical protein KUTeg_006598 [Tegillarca granosa]|uniref:Major facilitator superfamily (MFS) profile domain-containing protein n=1 Tax=Tegillarca granosa TaxID=220873 RepID=A0ABQ9FAQ5_TEGGR|nr:hypothetical protein KUTeg_006598 [Tegillarca granosa]
MDFDDIFTILGEFGNYQKVIYFLLCIPSISAGIFMTISVFLLGSPKHRCVIPGYDNDTYTTQSVYHENLINNYIPPHVEKKKDYDECHLFSFNSSDVTFDNMSRPINASLIKCTSWVYDDSIFKSTFTAEQNIVCEQSYKQTLAKTMFFAGVLVGAFALGVLSDVIGRKKTLHLSFLLMTASGVAVAFAPSYAIFVALRFLCGAGNAGVFMTAFVIGMELVGPSKRKLAGIIVEYFFALGLVLLSGVAYLIRDWKYIEIADSTRISEMAYKSRQERRG